MIKKKKQPHTHKRFCMCRERGCDPGYPVFGYTTKAKYYMMLEDRIRQEDELATSVELLKRRRERAAAAAASTEATA